ncbi:MAG: alanine racemase [Chitinophagales bacterium]|nr:alanine racemase [Chitinophagaceae bacterium]MCB9065158.1 alanine racemase [Chitinophagales bacterium]
MPSSSRIILDKAAMQNNWDFFREYFGDIQISAVVKGNAYGHGIETYVPLAEDCGVNHFAVFNSEEAYRVHDVAGPGTTIMVMGSMNEQDIAWAVNNEVEFFVFDNARLDVAIEEAKQVGKKAIVHIEAETGMYRTGFDLEEIPALIEKLKDNKEYIRFRGLCMHFAGAEHISNYVRLKQQKILFRKFVRAFRMAGIEPEQIHTCCSAASVRFPDMRYDMLRIGIMQYGFWPSPELMVEYMNAQGIELNGDVKSPLKRVIRWESNVMSVKHVPQGGFIGYGYSFFAGQDMQVAIVPVGYAHGFSRSLSNSGRVLIKGHRLSVVGVVNMNCVVVDVTEIEDGVKAGDEVVFIGEQGEREISVASFGEMTSQLNYELLTRLPMNIPRLISDTSAT